MQGDAPEVALVDGRLVADAWVPRVWLPQHGQVVAKLPPRKGNRRWLHETVAIRSPRLDGDQWHLPRNCLNRLIIATVDRYGHVVVCRDMSKLSKCNRSCLEAEGSDCGCSCLGENHGASTFGWFERAGDVMVADRGEFKRSMILYGPRTSGTPASGPVLYRGELARTPYRVDRAGRYGWPPAARFMCACCASVPARVWDHCHAHGYVRAPLCNTCNTRHWGGWRPWHGRATPSSNVDDSYYRWCPGFDGPEWMPSCSP